MNFIIYVFTVNLWIFSENQTLLDAFHRNDFTGISLPIPTPHTRSENLTRSQFAYEVASTKQYLPYTTPVLDPDYNGTETKPVNSYFIFFIHIIFMSINNNNLDHYVMIMSYFLERIVMVALVNLSQWPFPFFATKLSTSMCPSQQEAPELKYLGCLFLMTRQDYCVIGT